VVPDLPHQVPDRGGLDDVLPLSNSICHCAGRVRRNLLQVDRMLTTQTALGITGMQKGSAAAAHRAYTPERSYTVCYVAGGMQTSTLLQMDCVPTAQLALGITGVQKGCDRAPIAMPAEGGYSPDDEASSSDSKAVHMHGSSPMQARSRLSQRSLALTGEKASLTALTAPGHYRPASIC